MAGFTGRTEFRIDHKALVHEGVQRVWIMAKNAASACVRLTSEPFRRIFVEMIMGTGDAPLRPGKNPQ